MVFSRRRLRFSKTVDIRGTMNRIAEATGISTGTLHHYFPGIEETQSQMQEWVERMLAAYAPRHETPHQAAPSSPSPGEPRRKRPPIWVALSC